MTIRERIEQDTKSSLRAGDARRLSVLRMLSSTIHNREIEKRAKGIGGELTDEEVLQAIRSELKKRTDAIDAYDKGHRPEAAERERSEAEILKAFLPPELSDEELLKVVREGIAKLAVSSEKDSGKLMGWVMQRVKGQASGDRVVAVVKQELEAA